MSRPSLEQIINLTFFQEPVLQYFHACSNNALFTSEKSSCALQFRALEALRVVVKAAFSFHKLIPKNTQMTTLYIN